MNTSDTSDTVYYQCAEHINTETIHCYKEYDNNFNLSLFPSNEFKNRTIIIADKNSMNKRYGILFLGDTYECGLLRGEFKNKSIQLIDTIHDKITFMGKTSS